LLTALIPTQVPLKAEFRALAVEWIANAEAEGWVVDSIDALVFERTVEDFGLYIKERVGEEKCKRAFRRVDTPYEFSGSLKKVLGKSYGELFTAFYAWLERRSPLSDNWFEAQSEHFIYLYHPGSVAEKDLALIEAVAEQSFEEITLLLEPDSAALGRLRRVVRTDSKSPRYTDGKIPLRLYATRRELGGFEATSGGQTKFLPVWYEDTVGYALSVELAYPGPTGLFGVPHEMAHSLALLYLADEPVLAELLKSTKRVPAELMRDAVLAGDMLRLEGWAYMVQYNHSAYGRLGLWRSTKEAMAEAVETYGFPDAYELLNGEMSKSFLESALGIIGLKTLARRSEMSRFLTASADLIRFLYQRGGPEKMRTFLADPRDPMSALFTVYGLAPYALEQEWKNDVRER